MRIAPLSFRSVMKSIVLPLLVAGLAGWWVSASAATISGTASNLNLAIPEASSGTVLPSTLILSSGGQLISSLRVSVTVAGGANGDLYILLEHGGQ